jgi:hypothetical protein
VALPLFVVLLSLIDIGEFLTSGIPHRFPASFAVLSGKLLVTLEPVCKFSSKIIPT